MADYPKEFSETPLVTVKLAELKKLVKEKEIEDQVEDKRTSSAHRRAIYENEEISEKERTLIPVDKEDAKAIWNSLSAELPFSPYSNPTGRTKIPTKMCKTH